MNKEFQKSDMTTKEEILDASWINDFETIDKSYNIFYKDNIDFICVNYVYLNEKSEIERVKSENIILPKKNVLPSEALLSLIKTNQFKQYKFSFMLKYNFSMEPEEIKSMNTSGISSEYLQELNKIDDIQFEKTITMFQDLNELTLFFLPFLKNHNKTQKIKLFSSFKKSQAKTRKSSFS